ncbi:histidinol phosphate aminotransferase [Pontibacter ummariensis]|uniref:Histidinol-phosphate aminotransferase n=1 Tax=Pontibacter ummariensis TaxID=1610492 RepID=A0A239BZD1_9BACT|nr:histidinol-phosphate transaminase [Pontibacter ummariensis]PRY15567.1 histidinol phosphate aminotransferase [Pontibacter ummariensis]SNS12503.1 histidinol phosphate aminotransferase apoenzyme [Pontibacter ummariensis]
MFKLNDIIRPNVLKMKPYSSARDEFKGAASVFLDANENNLGSLAGENYNRYPDPHQRKLKERIAEIKGVQPEQIFLGNGSDEAIDLLFRMVCRPGQDSMLHLPPTYGMYEVSAHLNDVTLEAVQLTPDYQMPVEEVLLQVKPTTKIIFVCSPNNPTGNLIEPDSIEDLLRSFNGLVVVDEAYIDFAQAPSWTTRLQEFPNLVVLQTFSKAWGMAGLRLGLAFASPEIIAVLDKIKPPYNINEATQELALQALERQEALQDMVEEIVQERELLMQALPTLATVEKVYPSDANFILVKVKDADGLYKSLLNKGIVVRNRSSVPGCSGCLRVTVGTLEENQELLKAIAAF